MQQGGWKYDYEKLLLLDAFSKESAHLNPIECSKVIYKFPAYTLTSDGSQYC